MKHFSTCFFFFTFFYAQAQTFNGTGGPIQNNAQDTYYNLSVVGLIPGQIDSVFGLEQVSIDIVHPAVNELEVYLRSPAGTTVKLTDGSSCSGINYTNTVFNSSFTTSITLGSAPYTGNYKPIGYLGRFNTAQAGNGTWTLIVHDYLATLNAGTLISWSIQFGSSPSHPVIFTSSNLPIVILNTNNQVLSDTKVLINMGIIDNAPLRNYTTDAFNDYNAKAMIGFRGNSTKIFEKKSFSFETRDASGAQLDASLLGMPLENDWELLAPYQDKSLIRIPLTYDLYRRMGHYAARFKDVEMITNGEYQGIYAVTEKLKRDSSRIHVSKMTTADNFFPNVTGGYIFKIDRSDAPGWSSLLAGNCSTNTHFFYQYVYPKDVDITVPQKNYIKSFVDSFETALASPNFADVYVGYPKYIHAGSFIDFFILNELSKNADAYKLSTFLYKDRITKGGKLHIGPVWDYDIAWHNCDYGNAFDPNGWQYQIPDTVSPSPTWWGRFMQDTNFVNQLYCRYNYLRQNILSLPYLYNYIDSSAAALNESQIRNFIQWPVLGAHIYPNPQNQINATYQGEVDDLKNWITARIGWLDWAIQGHCPSSNVGIDETGIDNTLSIYPNPIQTTSTFVIHLTQESDVSLKILDITGKEIAVLLNERRPSGECKVTFDREQTAAGFYLYQLKINNTMQAGKIIIQ